MKRIFLVILLLITAAATFTPCCQSDNCCEEISSKEGAGEKNKKETACSPLFACATCPASVEISPAIQLPYPPVKKQEHQEEKYNFNPSIYSNTYWQPPRC